MKKVANKFLLFSLCSLLIIFSNGHSEDVGNATGAFLNLGLGARPMGMGQAFCAIARDGDAFYYNPAGLINTEESFAGLSYQKLALDRFLGHFSIGTNLYNDAAIAASWVHSSVDNFQKRDENGELVGELSNGEEQVAFSFMKRVSHNIGFGANFKYLQDKLDELVTYSVGFDVGLHGTFLEDRLTAGFSMMNIDVSYLWRTDEIYMDGRKERSEFPEKFRGGLAYSFHKLPILAACDIEKTEGLDVRFHGGLEGYIHKNLTLRVGMNHTEPALGFGLQKKFDRFNIRFDYAFVVPKIDGVDFTHIFDLKSEF